MQEVVFIPLVVTVLGLLEGVPDDQSVQRSVAQGVRGVDQLLAATALQEDAQRLQDIVSGLSSVKED